MNISQEKAERLKEIYQQLRELSDEFIHICRNSMSKSEYERFRYNTLAHFEPGLKLDNHWVTNAVPLETVVERAQYDVTDEEDFDDGLDDDDEDDDDGDTGN